MKTRIPISAEFTVMVTGHSLTRSYLLRFKIIPNPICPCRRKEGQTINLIILNCTQLENERRIPRNAIVRTGDTWHLPFEKLTGNHINRLTKFVRAIDFSTL